MKLSLNYLKVKYIIKLHLSNTSIYTTDTQPENQNLITQRKGVEHII